MDIIREVTMDQRRSDIPHFHAGDTLEVHLKVIEGNKERIQLFSGVVIQISGAGVGKTFTIRKISAGGIGVERIIPINSSKIDKIVRVKEGRVRRSRIYYIRERSGKSARIKEVRKNK